MLHSGVPGSEFDGPHHQAFVTDSASKHLLVHTPTVTVPRMRGMENQRQEKCSRHLLDSCGCGMRPNIGPLVSIFGLMIICNSHSIKA